jgi:hypothetical protein
MIASKRFPRFRLRLLLLLFVPLSITLFVYGHCQRQKHDAIRAWSIMTGKGVVLKTDTMVLRFKNANVTDEDLITFIPAFNGYAPKGFPRIRRLDLVNSNVSFQGVERFERAVPACDVVP